MYKNDLLNNKLNFCALYEQLKYYYFNKYFLTFNIFFLLKIFKKMKSKNRIKSKNIEYIFIKPIA